MSLDRTQRRVLGVLIEKQLSAPERYPLTKNALLAGCNQRSNRNPVLALQDFEIEGCLRSLMLEGWASELRGSGRAIKWKHRAAEKLPVSEVSLAVLAELLLRGPSSKSELRTRVARMIPGLDMPHIEEALDELSGFQPPLILELGRRPGERVTRWAQTLAEDDEELEIQEPTVASLPAPAAPAGPSLGERVLDLEREVAELRSRLQSLEDDLRPEGDGVD